MRSFLLFTAVMLSFLSSGCALPRPELTLCIEAPIKKTALTEEGALRIFYKFPTP